MPTSWNSQDNSQCKMLDTSFLLWLVDISQVRCSICFEEYRASSMSAAPCKHYFCKECWRGYVSEAISNGPTALGLRCPTPECCIHVSPDASPAPSTGKLFGQDCCRSCLVQPDILTTTYVDEQRLARSACSCKWHLYQVSSQNQNRSCIQVPTSVIREVACEEDQERYRRYRLRSFVEDNKNMEWCPAPDCEYAVESCLDLQGEPLDVICGCGFSFCFTCKEEAHRPVRLSFKLVIPRFFEEHIQLHNGSLAVTKSSWGMN